MEHAGTDGSTGLGSLGMVRLVPQYSSRHEAIIVGFCEERLTHPLGQRFRAEQARRPERASASEVTQRPIRERRSFCRGLCPVYHILTWKMVIVRI